MSHDDHTEAPVTEQTISKPQVDGRAELEAASKAALENMHRLRALRLAREAAQPQPVKATRKKKAAGAAAGTTRTTGSVKKEAAKPALSEWLASQVDGGRRT